MPYKDPEKQRAWGRKYYQENKEKRKQSFKESGDKRFAELKKWYNEYKETLSCSFCPENNSVCLDFHHKDSSKKDINVSAALNRRYSKKRILEEISKCIVVCSNCHRKLHAGLITPP